jgi:hypothetical protein
MKIQRPLLSGRELTLLLTVVVGPVPASGQTEGWTRITTTAAPAESFNSAMAYDEARQEVVLFGGTTPTGFLEGTWIYNGTAWFRRSPSRSPELRSRHCMQYHPGTRRVLLYGGAGHSEDLDDTWEWDGTNWTQVGTGADIRLATSMAFDPVRGEMIRFGGNGPGGANSETRSWNGSQWVLLATGGPPAREMATLATDTLRQVVVMYGGFGTVGSSGTRLDDTWEWNGAVWTQRSPVSRPPLLSNHATAFHARKGWALIMSGVASVSGAAVMNRDLYAWNGHDWSLRSLGTRPPYGLRAPMVYDSHRDRIVYFALGQTWEYVAPPSTPGAFREFGHGCAGTAGVPTLGVVGSEPYVGYTFQASIQSIRQSPLVLPFGVLGFSDASWNGVALPVDLGLIGLPGCSAYTDAVRAYQLSNRNGQADWSIPLPNLQALVGATFYVQGFVLDSAANGGALTTNAGAATIGQR